MDGRTAPFSNCWKGEYLDEVRGATEYTIVEYCLETSRKKKYKVTLDEEIPFDACDVCKLLDFVDSNVLKDKIVIEDGILTLYCGEGADLVIPESTKEIGWHAFSKPYSFDRIVIPKTLVDISISMFENCKTKSIEVAEDNPKYCVQNGCLIDKETAALVWCYDGNTIPSDGTVVRIAPHAFYKREDLETITIPDAITEISSYAFYQCEKLETVKIPDSLEVLGRDAFLHCTALNKETIPDRFDEVMEAQTPRNFAGFTF